MAKFRGEAHVNRTQTAIEDMTESLDAMITTDQAGFLRRVAECDATAPKKVTKTAHVLGETLKMPSLSSGINRKCII